MIFEKYSGILVHPNTMSTPYSLLDEIRTIAGDDANAVHRIDMETSGLLLASKHKHAESYLKGAFESRSIKKSYLAWVDGKISEPFTSTEKIKINSDYSQTKHKVFISDIGKPSHTDFVPIEYDETLDATLLVCYPHTGRTHQIRVHLFHVKHPILGDPIYGTTFKTANAYLEEELTQEERMKETGASRLMLHAHTLSFEMGAKFHIESKSDFSKMKDLICVKEERVFNR
jgi:23S rRNA pseudouridine1911/1915/1917 synthase